MTNKMEIHQRGGQESFKGLYRIVFFLALYGFVGRERNADVMRARLAPLAITSR